MQGFLYALGRWARNLIEFCRPSEGIKPSAKNDTASHPGLLITVSRREERTPESLCPPTASALLCLESVISYLVCSFILIRGSVTLRSSGCLGHPLVSQTHRSQGGPPSHASSTDITLPVLSVCDLFMSCFFFLAVSVYRKMSGKYRVPVYPLPAPQFPLLLTPCICYH